MALPYALVGLLITLVGAASDSFLKSVSGFGLLLALVAAAILYSQRQTTAGRNPVLRACVVGMVLATLVVFLLSA